MAASYCYYVRARGVQGELTSGLTKRAAERWAARARKRHVGIEFYVKARRRRKGQPSCQDIRPTKKRKR